MTLFHVHNTIPYCLTQSLFLLLYYTSFGILKFSFCDRRCIYWIVVSQERYWMSVCVSRITILSVQKLFQFFRSWLRKRSHHDTAVYLIMISNLTGGITARLASCDALLRIIVSLLCVAHAGHWFDFIQNPVVRNARDSSDDEATVQITSTCHDSHVSSSGRGGREGEGEVVSVNLSTCFLMLVDLFSSTDVMFRRNLIRWKTRGPSPDPCVHEVEELRICWLFDHRKSSSVLHSVTSSNVRCREGHHTCGSIQTGE